MDTDVVYAQPERPTAETPRAVPARGGVMSVHSPNQRDGTLRWKAGMSVCAC